MARIDIELPGGAKAGQTLQELSKEAGKLNKEIQKLPTNSKEFIDKTKELQQVNGRLTEVRNQIKGTAEASNELKNSFSSFIPFSGQFSEIGQKLMGVKNNVGGLVSSISTIKGALISTGIGAFVVLLGLLINYFTSTQAGIDKITSVTRPLQAVMERLKGVLQELGEKVFKGLAEAIDHPIEAMKKLGQVMLDNVINRFKAFALIIPAIKKIIAGDLSGGFHDLGNAAIQATTGVENGIEKISAAATALGNIINDALEKGSRLDELQKAIERGEIEQIKRSKELDLIIKQQKAIVEDQTLSFEVRRAAAERALEAQEKLLTSELALLDKKIEKMRLEHSLNDTSREQQKELAELEAQRLEKEAGITEQRIEFRNKINEFDKAQAEQEKAVLQSIQDLKVEAMKEGMDKEIEEIELHTERKIEALVGSADQIREQEKLLEEIRGQEIQAIRDKYALEQQQKDEKAKKEQQDRDKKLADDQKKIAEDKAAFEAQMAGVEHDIAIDSFGFATEMSAKMIKDEEAAKKIRKAGGLLEIGINLQRELAANSATASANPLNATTFGAAGAAQLAATNIRSIIRAGISAAKVIAFRRGGVLRGPSHESGGIPFTVNGSGGFEAEGDEILMTRGVFRNPVLRSAASAINVLGGGRMFAAGGPVNPLTSGASGGSQARSTGEAALQSMMGMDEIKNLLAANMEATNNRIDRIIVQNVVTDTEAKLNEVISIRNEADV